LSATRTIQEFSIEQGFGGAVFTHPGARFHPSPGGDVWQRGLGTSANRTIIYGLNEAGERYFVVGPHVGQGTVESLLPAPEPRDGNITHHAIDGGKRVIAIETIGDRRHIKEQVWPKTDDPLVIGHDDLVELICGGAVTPDPGVVQFNGGYRVDFDAPPA
jgi:hypothetical protein